MFVIVSNYRAKAGEEDAIIALHEDWQRKQRLKSDAHFSWELLRKVDTPGEFIAIAHFSTEESARVTACELEQDAWYRRLLSLLEEGPSLVSCTSEWQLG